MNQSAPPWLRYSGRGSRVASPATQYSWVRQGQPDLMLPRPAGHSTRLAMAGLPILLCAILTLGPLPTTLLARVAAACEAVFAAVGGSEQWSAAPIVEPVANALLPAATVLWVWMIARWSPWRTCGLAIVAAVGVEGIQLVIPQRVSSAQDVVLNAAGAAFAALGIWTLRDRSRSPQRHRFLYE